MPFIKKVIIAPIITPVITERNITIARDASNFQKRKEIVTGSAFWTEKMATNAMIINTNTIVIIFKVYRLKSRRSTTQPLEFLIFRVDNSDIKL